MSRQRPRTTAVATACLAAAVLASALALDWDLASVLDPEQRSRSLAGLRRFLASFAAIDLSAEAFSGGLRLSAETLTTALLGSALGAAGGYLLALYASRAVWMGGEPEHTGVARWLHPRRIVLEAARLLLDVLRGVPDFAWAIVILTGPGPGAVTGVLAIGVSVAGILGKVYSELWDGVDPARYESLRGAGAGRLATFLFGIQPLAARPMLSYTLMRVECAIRNASVIGVVGGGGLGAELFDEFNYGNYARVTTLLLFMLALTASTDLISNSLRYQVRVDPNHPRARRGQSLGSGLTRRGVAVGAVVAGLVACLAYLRPALARASRELERIEWDWVRRELGQLLVPDLSGATLLEALAESRVPLALGVLGTLIATAGAALLAYPASVAFQIDAHRFTGERTSAASRFLRTGTLVVARLLALVCRSVPEVAWVLVLAAFFKIGTVAGVLAVAIHSVGVLARVFVETVDDVPYRRLEPTFLGSRAAAFLYGAVPASGRAWITYAVFQFEMNVRTGVVLGILGIGGLGDSFHTSFTHWSLHRASTFLIAMVLLTTAIDRASRALRVGVASRG